MELSKWQKHNLKKKALEFRQVLKHPDEFKISKVGKDTARAMKKSGIPVSKTGKAIISLKGFDNVKVKGSELTFIGKNKKTGKKITEQVTLIGDPKAFDSQIKRLAKTKLKKNQVLTVKIGNSATLARHFSSMKELTFYVNQIMFKDSKKSREEILKMVSVVTVEGASSYAKEPRQKKQAHPKGK